MEAARLPNAATRGDNLGHFVRDAAALFGRAQAELYAVQSLLHAVVVWQCRDGESAFACDCAGGRCVALWYVAEHGKEILGGAERTLVAATVNEHGHVVVLHGAETVRLINTRSGANARTHLFCSRYVVAQLRDVVGCQYAQVDIYNGVTDLYRCLRWSFRAATC